MRTLATMLTLVALLAAACDGSDGGSDATKLTASDSGSTIDVPVGREIVVTLESNPTTGYTWELAGGLDTAVVEHVSQSYEQEAGTEGMAGAGGTDTWTFEAVGPGTTTIELDYLRTFEEGSTTSTFTVTVTVSE
jgi:inhibitor of cysteine peptidase